MKLFDSSKKKFITRGIDAEIPLYIQVRMFEAIDEWLQKGKKLDYLQVFKLSVENQDGHLVQHIRHSQEVPELSEDIEFPICDKGINNTTIFVIDDGADYVTMLLAKEY